MGSVSIRSFGGPPGVGQGSKGSLGLGEGIHPQAEPRREKFIGSTARWRQRDRRRRLSARRQRVELYLKREGEEGWDVGNFLL